MISVLWLQALFIEWHIYIGDLVDTRIFQCGASTARCMQLKLQKFIPAYINMSNKVFCCLTIFNFNEVFVCMIVRHGKSRKNETCRSPSFERNAHSTVAQHFHGHQLTSMIISGFSQTCKLKFVRATDVLEKSCRVLEVENGWRCVLC